ncbi:MAG: 30S ribosomal protein S16 [Candidatus Aminicenantales bacterium]|jgi:small subunit ribosomal protein S16
MMTLRLMRFGAKSRPSYRIVVVDSKRPRETKAKDYIGSYNPLKDPAEISVDLEKAKFWIGQGAKPSPTVKSLIEKVSKTSKLSK